MLNCFVWKCLQGCPWWPWTTFGGAAAVLTSQPDCSLWSRWVLAALWAQQHGTGYLPPALNTSGMSPWPSNLQKPWFPPLYPCPLGHQRMPLWHSAQGRWPLQCPFHCTSACVNQFLIPAGQQVTSASKRASKLKTGMLQQGNSIWFRRWKIKFIN